MKKIVIILLTLTVVSLLNAQTLRMTSVHIEEQKELRPLNNHIIAGIGFTRVEEADYYRTTNQILMLGYYKTDILLNNTLGLYLNCTLGFNLDDGTGITLGATYKYLEEGDHNLYFIGGLGFASYREYYGKQSYQYDEITKLRVEGGILYNYKRLDFRATIGAPDYLSFGIGYKFGFNF